jgi:hypothetical protein
LKSRCKCKSKKDRLNPARHPHSKYILMILHSNPPISSVARSNKWHHCRHQVTCFKRWASSAPS